MTDRRTGFGSRVYRTEGIVLKARDYGEADRLLTIFTPKYGKVAAIAKGVRRSRSRTSGHVDLFMRSTLLIARGRQLDVLTQAQNIDSYVQIRSNLWRLSTCQYIAELIDGFCPDRQENEVLYRATAETLGRIAVFERIAPAVRAFEIQLLTLTGYKTELGRCLVCARGIAPGENRFSAGMGGIICPICASPGSVPISSPALKLLRNLQVNEEAAVRLRDVPDLVLTEVEKHLRDCIIYRLERRPRSIAFLERLQRDGADSPLKAPSAS